VLGGQFMQSHAAHLGVGLGGRSVAVNVLVPFIDR
jgi:hypothetical protein